MGGIFAVAADFHCTDDLFYGIDYHSHLGNQRGGMMVKRDKGFVRIIHDISQDQFRAKFDCEREKLAGNLGIGCISDFEDQPLIISGKNGRFGICTVAKINNLQELKEKNFRYPGAHFSEMAGDSVNPTEVIASLICQKATHEEGIRNAQEQIDGSCSLVLLTDEGIYAGRDMYGRTPLVIGEKEGAFAVASESCSLHNLGYEIVYWLGAGEVMLLTSKGITQKLPPLNNYKICAFLWIYYGFPASSFENINVEQVRYRSGELLAERDMRDNGGEQKYDVIAGIPDSGTAHALGYSHKTKLPYHRLYVKYTPTWARSFVANKKDRKQVAKMKLLPVTELIKNKKMLFCEDSIVTGRQLKDTFARLPELGACEVHVRSACPPMLYKCKYLNFSPARSEPDLVSRRAIARLKEEGRELFPACIKSESAEYKELVKEICRDLGFDSLKFQTLDDMIKAIGLPKESLCTYCWTGAEE